MYRKTLRTILLGLFLLSTIAGIIPFSQGLQQVEATDPVLVGPVCDFVNGAATANSNRHHHSSQPYATDVSADCANGVVRASISGRTKYGHSGYSSCSVSHDIDGSPIEGQNTFMEIYGEDGTMVRYLHMIDVAPPASVQDGYVEAGEVLGTMGSVGCSYGAHIHFEVHKHSGNNGGSYSPLYYNQWQFQDTYNNRQQFIQLKTTALATKYYMVAENGGGAVVNANRTSAGPWEQFSMDYYNYDVHANVTSASGWESFTMIPTDQEPVLRSESQSMGTFEEFLLEDTGSSYYRFKTYHGPYLRIDTFNDYLSAKTFVDNQASNIRVEDVGGGKVALKVGVKYLSASGADGQVAYATANTVGDDEKFEMIHRVGNIYSFKTKNNRYLSVWPIRSRFKTFHGTYLSAINNGGSGVDNNTSKFMDSERLYLQGTGAGFNQVVLKTYNGHYFNALNGGGGDLQATSTSVGTNEVFTLVVQADDKVSFKTANNYFITAKQGYVTIQSQNGNYLEALTASGIVSAAPKVVGNAARFVLVQQSENVYALRTLNGPYKYVKAINGGNSGVNATSTSIGANESWQLIKL